MHLRAAFDNPPLVIRIHEEVFGEDCRAEGVAEYVEVFFPVGVVVGEDFHFPGAKVIKKVAEISLSDQILLFIVQREAIVDITGTLRVQR